MGMVTGGYSVGMVTGLFNGNGNRGLFSGMVTGLFSGLCLITSQHISFMNMSEHPRNF